MTTSLLIASMPCSVELPAGGGKTWLLVDTIREAAEQSGKALVLTHTNAGVHSIRNKMRALGVDPKAAHVGTITSLAFELVRSYSRIAGLAVPETPDWEDSGKYVEGAHKVLRNRHVRDVLAISYSHLLVDEYQDCSLAQHALVLDLAQAIPACAVFGDRLQGIFGFSDPIVDWEADVLVHFPAFPVDYIRTGGSSTIAHSANGFTRSETTFSLVHRFLSRVICLTASPSSLPLQNDSNSEMQHCRHSLRTKPS